MDGTPISPDEIKRFVIYRNFRMELDNQVDEVLVQIAMDEVPIAEWDRFSVSREALEEDRQWQRDRLATRYPTLKPAREIRRWARSEEIYDRTLLQALRFQQAYFPDDHRDWPKLSLERLENSESESEAMALAYYLDSSAKRRARFQDRIRDWDGAGGAPRIEPENYFFRSKIRDILRPLVLESVKFETASPDLPERTLASMEGTGTHGGRVRVLTEQVWSVVRDHVTDQDLWEARQLLALVEATKVRLDREDKLLPWSLAQERWTARWEEALGPRPDFLFPEAERLFAQLYESYRAGEPATPEPKPGTPRDPLLGGFTYEEGRLHREVTVVYLDLLLVAAYDSEMARWKPNGWEHARQKAEELRTALAQEPDRWKRFLASHGEYWTLPQPLGESVGGLPFRGSRGRHQSRSLLHKNLHESALTNFLTLDYLAEKILYTVGLNEIAGPFRGPHGYYFVRADERTSNIQRDTRDPTRFARSYRDQWLRMKLNEYAHEALRQVEVVGLTDR